MSDLILFSPSSLIPSLPEKIFQDKNPALSVAWSNTGHEFWKQRIEPVINYQVEKTVSDVLSKSEYIKNTNRSPISNRTIEEKNSNVTLLQRVSEQKAKAKANVNLQPLVSPYVVLQEWEGVVEAIRGKTFVALLADITANETLLTLKSKLQLSEIHPSQRDKLQVGAVFRWLIGYRNETDGRQRFSQIIFRDRPRISALDRINAKTAVESMFSKMKPLE